MKVGDTVKIKITGTQKPSYWYRDLIGHEFWADVHCGETTPKTQPYEFKIYRERRGPYSYGSYIESKDCKVLFTLEPVNGI